MNNPDSDDRTFEICYQETVPGKAECVLTNHQTGEQYRSGSLRDLMELLGRLIDNVPSEPDGLEKSGAAA